MKDMDLSGRRFGKLKVLRCLDEKPNYYSKFVCRCDCGNEIIIPRYGFFRGRTSCGCDKVRDDLTGKRIGKLEVLGLVNKGEFFFTTTWKCRCDCGNEVTYPTILLKNNLVSSCGCDGNNRLEAGDLAKANRGEVEGTNTNLLQSALDGVLYENNQTGVRGVYYHAADQRYWAVITFQGKRINIGQYKDLEKAEKARKKAEQLLYGEFLDHYEDELKERIKSANERTVADIVDNFVSSISPSPENRTSKTESLEAPEKEGGVEDTAGKPGMCSICGKPLPKGRSRYCSPECAYTAQIKRNKERRSRKEVRYCEVCGKIVPTDRIRYCSDECQAVGVSLTRTKSKVRGIAEGRYEIICADCGRKVMVASHKSYRCPECQKKARKAQNDASKARKREGRGRTIGSTDICECCGKEYVIKGASQKYCDICAALQLQEKAAENQRKHRNGKKQK